MEYTIVRDQAVDIIVVTVQGDWEGEKDDIFVREILQSVAATGVRKVLVDIRLLEQMDLSTLRLYERAQILQERRREFETTSSRAAILYAAKDPKVRESFQFFENITRNRGLPYRLFDDKEDAIDWLMSS